MKRTKWFDRSFDFSGLTLGTFPCVLTRLRGTPARLEEIVRGLPEEILRKRTDGAWSIKEQVGHLLDLDEVHELRLNDYREQRDALRPADLKNQKTYEANHNEASLDDLLASFRAARLSFVKQIEAMDDDLLLRTAVHPRLQQPMRLIDMALFVAEHDDHHVCSVEEILGGID